MRIITSTPTSLKTNDMTPIILSETERTQLLFEPIHVENPKAPEKQLKGNLVFNKPKKSEGSRKLTRIDIHAGEYISLSLNTSEVYNLATGLAQYIDITQGKSTLFPVDYTDYVPDDKVVQILSDHPEIVDLLSQQNREVLTLSLRLRELQDIKSTIEENLENSDEAFWQKLFVDHSWVLSQLFALPYMLFQNQPYVGGKGLSGTAGKFPDYLFKNIITENVAIVEIKTPKTSLVYKSPYREGVYALHQELSGAISQILVQKNTFYQSYVHTQYNSKEKFDALNIECVLIAGNISGTLNDEQRASFELSRNELRSIRIIGFDELLQKVKTMIQLLVSEEAI